MYLWREGGDIYHGAFHNGLQHGFGVLTNSQDKSQYAGYFKEGSRGGMGFHEKDKNLYLGWYNEDESHDFGIYQIKDHFGKISERYIGEWKNGSYNGWGINSQIDGSKFIGQFDMDQKHGSGILIKDKSEELTLSKWTNDFKN